MTTRNVFACMLTLVLGLLVVAAPRAGAQDEAKKAFERVEYRATSATAETTLVALVSATDAEVTSGRKGRPASCKWTLTRGPMLRLVGESRRPEYFAVKDGGLQAPSDGALLAPAAGASWHAALLADPKFRGPPRSFRSGCDWLVFPEDGMADSFLVGTVTPILTARTEVRPDGSLTLTHPGMPPEVYRKDGDGWIDPHGSRYAPDGRMFEALCETHAIWTCWMNLSQLSVIYHEELTGDPAGAAAARKYVGVGLPLSWRKGKRLRMFGNEKLLRCPDDPHLRPLDDACRKAYDDVDPSSPPLDLCSYAFRDFARFPLPDDPQSFGEKEILACCRQGRDGRTPHHPDGICVAYAEGGTMFLTRGLLGLKPGDPIIVGPDSNVPMLRKVIQSPKR